MYGSPIRWRVITVCTAFAALAIVVITMVRERRPFARMIASAENESTRATEGRIIGFPYRPVAAHQGVPKSSNKATARVRGVAASVLESTSANDRSLHDRGIAQLLRGDTAGATSLLEAAARQTPQDPVAWNDLAAAYIEAAQKEDSPQRYASALAATDRAREIDAALPAARLNRAIALEHLGIVPAAVRAYDDYLIIEPSGGWAGEARSRSAALRQLSPAESWTKVEPEVKRRCANGIDVSNIVHQFAQEARTWGEGVYLADWGDDFLRRAPTSNALLLARCLGRSLQGLSGEQLLWDAVTAVERGDSDAKQALATAHISYRKARMLYAQRHIEEALPLFEKSQELFRRHGSPMHLVASYYRANAAIDRKDFAAATAFLAEPARASAKYQALHAEVGWAQGLIEGPTGRPYQALTAIRAAHDTFHHLGERQNALYMRTNEVHLLNVLGRIDEAWRARTDLFYEASRSQDPLLLDAALFSAAESEARDERYEAAAALYHELSEMPNGAPKRRAEALIGIALVEWKLRGKPADLSRARAAAMKLSSGTLRLETLDEIRYADAVCARATNPALTVQLLNETIEFRRSRNDVVHLPEPYQERGRAYRTLGRNDLAEADLRSSIDIVERQSATLEDPLLRDSFAATGSKAYDELIDLAASRGDFRRAYETAERSRIGGMTQVRGSPAAPEAVMASMPPAATLITINSLPQRTVMAIVTRDHFRGIALPIPRATLVAGIDELLAAMNDEARVNTAAENLFTLLLNPFADELARTDKMTFVVDETTSRIPFALLRDPITHNYLVEKSSIVIATSATSLLDRETIRPEPTVRHAVVVGDPAFNQELFPSLTRLPDARTEAVAVASLYGASAILGSDATPERVIGELYTADLIHFGGHAAMSRDSARSVLILASANSKDPGVVYLADIMRLHLPRSIVLLAGCHTGSAASGRGTITSLADAFLVAGARAVVGTLWDIDDAASREFSQAFHRALRNGTSPTDALRSAQLHMARSPIGSNRHPKSWASFQLYESD